MLCKYNLENLEFTAVHNQHRKVALLQNDEHGNLQLLVRHGLPVHKCNVSSAHDALRVLFPDSQETILENSDTFRSISVGSCNYSLLMSLVDNDDLFKNALSSPQVKSGSSTNFLTSWSWASVAVVAAVGVGIGAFATSQAYKKINGNFR